MNKVQLQQDLRNVDCPSISVPLYQSCLGRLIKEQPKSKREKVVSYLENGCEVMSNNRLIFSGVGVSLTVVLFFTSVFSPGSEYAPSKVQAQSVVEEMEVASKNLNEEQLALLEERLQMELDSLIRQAKSARTALVYELDPRIPMRVVDGRSNSPKSFIVTFSQDQSGRLRMRSLVPRYTSIEGSASAYTKRRILQYAGDDGQIILVDLSENNLPQSGIVLTGN